VVPDEADEIVRSIGHDLVSALAPEELPLYPALAEQFEGTDGGRDRASGDQLLGFGVGEAAILLTPVILEFVRAFWDALAAQASDTAVHGVLKYLRGRGRKDTRDKVSALTAGQLERVRAIAAEQASRLKIADDKAGLLADAIVGVLAIPPAS
jgi:hypothetical protein